MIKTTGEVAKVLGVSKRTIQRWHKYPDFPDQEQPGQWDEEQVLTWAAKYDYWDDCVGLPTGRKHIYYQATEAA
jgi:transposase